MTFLCGGNSFYPQTGSSRAITKNQWGRGHSYIRGQIQCALTCQNRFRNKTCRPVTNFVYERTFLILAMLAKALDFACGNFQILFFIQFNQYHSGCHMLLIEINTEKLNFSKFCNPGRVATCVICAACRGII